MVNLDGETAFMADGLSAVLPSERPERGLETHRVLTGLGKREGRLRLPLCCPLSGALRLTSQPSLGSRPLRSSRDQSASQSRPHQ